MTDEAAHEVSLVSETPGSARNGEKSPPAVDLDELILRNRFIKRSQCSYSRLINIF